MKVYKVSKRYFKKIKRAKEYILGMPRRVRSKYKIQIVEVE